MAGFVVAVQVGALVGSRALFVFNDGIGGWDEALVLSPGGFALNGGIAVALLAAWLYVRGTNQRFWEVADWAAPSLALGIFITKIGCFLGGCCYGAPTALPWGVQFPAGSLAASTFGEHHHLHPAQLYEAAAGLILFAVSLVASNRRAFEGQRGLTLAVLYLAVRAVNEFARGDARPMLFGVLTQTQFVSVVVGAVAVTLFLAKWRSWRQGAAGHLWLGETH
jgi:phosphatidylglycerol:prolipoprotein diacylglycerol transferase